MTDRHQLFEEKALGLILEKGFRGMTMRDLAASMDCDVANIYNYIPSKQAFLHDQLFGMSTRFHQGIDEIVKSGLPSSEQIKALIQLYVRLTVEFPKQVALLSNEWRHLEASDRSMFLDERMRYEKKVKTMLSTGMRKGEIRQMNAQVATHLVLSALRWLFMHIDSNPVKNRIRLEREIMSFVLTGLALT
ncbi:MAG: TetR family transcriptional regulator [Saprospiraceae bacterium]|nr:TetR family transcriptional regulator [Saprospiraceae bacterium]